ncbi:MAG: biotin--[acetyl-CoA-carboxylase] ligase [Gammaproteobacteria bacterium]|nr:biotin--[acetyl-CoA-carboxylase] ligase [Gammaproteobacteria bacterium]
MHRLDADVIRESIDETAAAKLGDLEIFAEIASTNSYLMQQPAPLPGQTRVAATDNQTAGRGRHGRTWQSPPGSGLCLSMAYTFATQPANLPALTLAIGLGVVNAMQALSVTGIQLKWPNDLVFMNGKLGGILSEAQAQAGDAVTVVAGIGLNIDLGERADFRVETDGPLRAVDLKRHVANLPDRNRIAAMLVSGMSKTFVDYEVGGFGQVADRWSRYDWLLGRELTVDLAERQLSGIGAGVADDGALLIDARADGRHRVTSGSIVMAGAWEDDV